tara:strand:+ start:1163 stop:1336 length:174 start_codon:yes stop_codon:yes gene_type:complete
MIKNFKNKNSDGRLLIQKCFFGLGIHLDFISATFHRDKKYSLIIDFIFIRFWWNAYK